SEGARGAGEGEVVIVHIGDATRLEIWAGFGRSERLHKRNGRPRAIRLYVLQALSGMANQFDLTVGHFVVLARETIELEDVNAYQQLRLPAFTVVSDLEECIDLLQPFFEGEVPEWP
ncbi:MAG: hypothetical protein ACLFNT_14950, partial [Spirochaetales bacterium]